MSAGGDPSTAIEIEPKRAAELRAALENFRPTLQQALTAINENLTRDPPVLDPDDLDRLNDATDDFQNFTVTLLWMLNEELAAVDSAEDS